MGHKDLAYIRDHWCFYEKLMRYNRKKIEEIIEFIDEGNFGPAPLIPADHIVNTFADLPPAAGEVDQLWFVKQQTGVWLLGTRKQSGFYVSDGTNWTLANDPLQYLENFQYYVINAEHTGVVTAIANGNVYEYTNRGLTVYRFINSTNNANGYPVEDSFYRTFDGTNVSSLITTRA